MITTEQYLAAKKIVEIYEDQVYEINLEKAKKMFPIGSRAESKSKWTKGTVWGYGRVGCEVILKVDTGWHRAGRFLVKYAKKLDEE